TRTAPSPRIPGASRVPRALAGNPGAGPGSRHLSALRRLGQARHSGGTTGSTTCDGRPAEKCTVLSATTVGPGSPRGPPVFGFTSNRGKLDDERSIRIRWPRAKRLLVGQGEVLTGRA